MCHRKEYGGLSLLEVLLVLYNMSTDLPLLPFSTLGPDGPTSVSYYS